MGIRHRITRVRRQQRMLVTVTSFLSRFATGVLTAPIQLADGRETNRSERSQSSHHSLQSKRRERRD